jgi:hypothetical protein
MINNGFVIRDHVKITNRKKRGPRKTRTIYVWLKTKCQGGVDFAMGNDVSDVLFCYEHVNNDLIISRDGGGGSATLSHGYGGQRYIMIGGRRNRRGAFTGSEPP